MDPDRSIGTDLDPNWLTLRMIYFYKKSEDDIKSMINYLACIKLTPILPNCFVLKCCLLFMSAAYIQVYFRLDFIVEANTMNPDQTATKKVVKSRVILLQYMLP